MPDGSYKYSQSSVAKAIGKPAMSFSQFLDSKRPEALPYKGLPLSQVSVEGNNKPINTVPDDLATVYWTYWMSKGDAEAIALMSALAGEALTRRADAAFNNTKTEQEYEQQTEDRYQQVLARINRKIEVMNLRQSDGITDEQYQALVAEEEQLKKQMSYTEQDLAHAERNVVTLARLVKEAPVSEVREPLQRELAWHTENRDRLRQVVGQTAG